jgi:hypothetical protein
MTGCEHCGVGPDDDCQMTCPSRLDVDTSRDGEPEPPPDAALMCAGCAMCAQTSNATPAFLDERRPDRLSEACRGRRQRVG